MGKKLVLASGHLREGIVGDEAGARSFKELYFFRKKKTNVMAKTRWWAQKYLLYFSFCSSNGKNMFYYFK